ncbi:hypothetical protein [Azospirillum picis]|uniref:HNH endonuclease n=1 Tax=Azospirillum picis TaxID=488438 RepID=A0ABU0MPF6_9PROT|nr:hypothetical protein [Azospirillum picis]MBP2301523.1 hypothetical protein [Azospirillum picis]MDQ0535355.1 hypothetical protein [Azospirillum picis]
MTAPNPTAATDLAQDALNRLRRADARGTGCHLTAEMVQALSVTNIGEIWNQPDPRDETEDQAMAIHAAAPLDHCVAGKDGECNHPDCPQLRDGEPAKSRRHCPLDADDED